MKTFILAAALGLSLLCAFFSSPIKAGEALDSLNAAVEQKERQFEEQFGVALTFDELTNVKLGLIVARLKQAKAEQPEKTVKALVDEAIVTYEITDPVEQRQLLIETTAQTAKATGDGNGNEPPF